MSTIMQRRPCWMLLALLCSAGGTVVVASRREAAAAAAAAAAVCRSTIGGGVTPLVAAPTLRHPSRTVGLKLSPFAWRGGGGGGGGGDDDGSTGGAAVEQDDAHVTVVVAHSYVAVDTTVATSPGTTNEMLASAAPTPAVQVYHGKDGKVASSMITVLSIPHEHTVHATTWTETVASTSDIVVLHVAGNANAVRRSIPLSVVTALRRGLERQRQAQMPLPHLLIVVIDNDRSGGDPSRHQQVRERLVQHDLQAITPHLVQSMDVIWNGNAEQTLHARVVEVAGSTKTGSDGALVPANGLPILLQKIYQRLLPNDSKSPPLVLRTEHQIVKFPDKSGPAALSIDKSLPAAKNLSTVAKAQAHGSELPRDVVGFHVHDVFGTVHDRLDRLQHELDQHWLDDPHAMPLDFGQRASVALEPLDDVPALLHTDVSEEQQMLLRRVAVHLQELYDAYLQSLRDYFGRNYETLLSRSQSSSSRWQQYASSATNGFRRAAAAAVPSVLSPESTSLSSRQRAAWQRYVIVVWDDTDALQGLIADMMRATEAQQETDHLNHLMHDEYDDDDDDEFYDVDESTGALIKREGQRPRRRRHWRVPRWVEKVAARALVFGVNYLQGWLAWQGMQRAALEREKQLPKFPLY